MSNLLADLNPDQIRAVTHTGSPLLILAGAGSGKTRALTYRAAYLIQEQGVSPDRLLLTTFTNKAAHEMQDRLEKLIGTRLPLAGTFHSLCARFLRRHGPEIGLSHDFIIYDAADQLQLMKSVMLELNLDPKTTRPGTLLYLIEQAKHQLLTPAQYAQIAKGPTQTAAAGAYTLYQTKLSQAQALDFNDLLSETVRLLTQTDSVCAYYQDRLLHVLVDEYQDTNLAQYRLTQLLCAKHRNLCVVGDASQAIYSWRGADYQNLLSLKTDFPDLTTIKLEQNYRSTQTILDAAHGVIAQNRLHPILSLWTDSQPGEPLTLYQAVDEYAEAKYVAQTINSRSPSEPLSDFVVLYRTNAQSRVLEEIFIRESLPYVLVGGVKFYERAEVKDVLAYLRFAFNPKDQVSFERLEKLGKRRFQSFQTWLNSGADLSQPPVKLFDQILKVTDYLKRFDEKIMEDLSRLENVRELRSVARNFKTLSAFLENVALVEPVGQSAAAYTPQGRYGSKAVGDAVVFMTLHSAKGLEFNTIFLIGLEEGLFPHSRSLMSAADLEEERRLCYVGLTRAKRKVHLTYAQSRAIFGSRSYTEPSRFLSELPQQVLEASPLTPAARPAPASSVSDALLDQFLDGDLDIDAFLKS